MSEPLASQAANPNLNDWMGDVPGGDQLLDDLFADTSTVIQQPQSAQPANAPQPVQVQPAPQPTPFEIKTKSSVYKTVEEAQKGIETKDELIDNLRNQWIMTHGYDPITKKPVSIEQNPQVPVNYLQDNKRYMKDLKDAVEKGDETAYFNAQSKLVFDLLQPLAPTINEFARRQAAEQVSTEMKDFQSFRNSEEFKTTLAQNEPLKFAIEQAENDFRGHAQLPGLYKLAFLAAQGSKVPELMKQATQAAAQAAPQNPQAARPSLSSSTIAPPTVNSSRETLATKDGRQAILARLRAAGIEDAIF